MHQTETTGGSYTAPALCRDLAHSIPRGLLMRPADRLAPRGWRGTCFGQPRCGARGTAEHTPALRQPAASCPILGHTGPGGQQLTA